MKEGEKSNGYEGSHVLEGLTSSRVLQGKASTTEPLPHLPSIALWMNITASQEGAWAVLAK